MQLGRKPSGGSAHLILHDASCFIRKKPNLLVSLLPRRPLSAKLHQNGLLWRYKSAKMLRDRVEFWYRYHKGQFRLNMSCNALRIDDQATRYIVLEKGKVTLAELLVVSRRFISQGLCI